MSKSSVPPLSARNAPAGSLSFPSSASHGAALRATSQINPDHHYFTCTVDLPAAAAQAGGPALECCSCSAHLGVQRLLSKKVQIQQAVQLDRYCGCDVDGGNEAHRCDPSSSLQRKRQRCSRDNELAKARREGWREVAAAAPDQAGARGDMQVHNLSCAECWCIVVKEMHKEFAKMRKEEEEQREEEADVGARQKERMQLLHRLGYNDESHAQQDNPIAHAAAIHVLRFRHGLKAAVTQPDDLKAYVINEMGALGIKTTLV